MTRVLATMFEGQDRFKKGKGGKSLSLPSIALLVILFAAIAAAEGTQGRPAHRVDGPASDLEALRGRDAQP